MSFQFNAYAAINVVCSLLLVSHTQLQAAEIDADKALVSQLSSESEVKSQPLDYRLQIEALETRIKRLEAAGVQSITADNNYSGLKIGLSGLFSAGASSVDNDDLQSLQAGGHDPDKNGFTIQNIELSIGATVDPYFDGQVNLIFLIDEEGETVVELEEAYFTTRQLPWGLQVKAGQYFTEFGRQNVLHPHSWDFVDQPVILSRLFGGDGLRSQGVRLSWLMPVEWYSEWLLGAQNAKGETVSSFLSAEGESISSYSLINRDARGLSDLLYSVRWLNGVDITDSLSVNVGVSALTGPNASSTDTKTQVYGADIYMKWQAEHSQKGYPFVSWHTEWLKRHYEVPDLVTGDLQDRGYFSQIRWGFTTSWVAGLRWEYATANGDNSDDAFRDTRKRWSPNITWYPSEFSRLRLQYNRDITEFMVEKTADTLWLQLEFSLGGHMAHQF